MSRQLSRFWEYIIVNCVITCRFALKMSIGLQMRNARNLRAICSHLSLSENEVSRSALNGLSTKK